MIKKAIVNAITQELSEQKAHFSNVEIEESKFGDYSTSFPLKLGKFKDYQNPQEVAKFFVSELSKNPLFSEVTVSEPGFINFTINQKEAASLLREVIGEGESFGKNKKHKGKKARVEFVSANPTGPLHIGNARGGPLGDTISNVLEASGYEVLREYINNDRGNQIQELGLTVAVRAGFIQEDQTLTYTGEYINELADKVKEQLSIAGLNKEQIVAKCGEIGSTLLYKDILKVCEEMRIEFDLLVSESELQEKLPQILKDLKDKDLLVEKEGATWFKMGEQSFEDKEAVVIKSDGSYTYFASDIAYHLEKFNSDYDLVFDVFGSNTSGHVPKLQALAKAANFDLEKFKVVLYQFVRVVKGKEIVKMSKRAGNFVTAEEVLREVGKDAFRFMMLLFSLILTWILIWIWLESKVTRIRFTTFSTLILE